MSRQKQRCIDPEVGKLFREFETGAFEQPGRDEDKQRFSAHISECPKCRAAAIKHLVEFETIPGLQAIADEQGIPFERIVQVMNQATSDMKRIAKERGVPYEEVVRQYVNYAEDRRKASET